LRQILHVLTASLEHAQIVLSAAMQAGFRESGALNLTASGTEPATPMVAIRSMGLALESIVGRGRPPSTKGETWETTVPGRYLWMLIQTSNKRFEENARRIARFRELLAAGVAAADSSGPKVKADGSEWEDAAARRERKRAEGLKKSQELKDRSQE
jgi:tRNA wybutosine-synthesizing protein 3